MQPRPLGVMERGCVCVHVCVSLSQGQCFTFKKRGDGENKTITFDSGSISEREAGGGSSRRISFLSRVSPSPGL